MKALSVLGSTGSIGTQTLEIVDDFPERFRVVALTAGRNLDLLMGQIRRHRPEVVALADADLVATLRERLLALDPQERPAPFPELLGGPQTLMIGRVLWDEFFGNNDWPMAAAVAVVMVLLIIVPLALFNKHQAESNAQARA